MKVTYNWLRQYVEIPWSPEILADKLTMLGLEVESIVTLSGEFEGVVVAQILSSEKHPNADKLSICKVDDGKGERQIVCGATNYTVGDKVPLALPGCTLPASSGSAPFTIKVSKMRGVESQGMMCSAKELQLAEDAEGLLILPSDAPIGQPLAEHLGRSGGDVVFDLEITPNRPDWNSVIGIAREISALLGTSLRLPTLEKEDAAPEPIIGFVNLRVEEPELCPRYVARVIRGVKVKPSPAWLKGIVEKVGLRSINNIVDVTNYVMLETGQPLHAFDLRLLEKVQSPAAETICSVVPTVVVRKARPGEKFKTLDGVERPLNAEMLLIADEQKALALAGIMGGLNSEIQESTQEVLLESAAFKPQSIRQTSKTLELRTEASYRFERGSDLAMVEWASRRAARLIAEVSGGVILKGSLDACALPSSEQTIRLRHFKVGELLGLEIDPALQTAYLTRLGLEVIQGDIPESESKISWALKSEQTTPQLGPDELPRSKSVKLRVPGFRQDLKGEADLIEEIARLHGIEKIPSTPPRGAIGSHPFDLRHDSIMEVRRLMSAMGLYEAQGQTLIHERDWVGISDCSVDSRTQSSEREPALASLKNPLNSEMGVLRPSLLPGLLLTLRHNVNRQLQDLAFFEVGRVFQPDPKGIREEWRLAVALTGKRDLRFWEGKEQENLSTIYDLKGILEEFFDHQGLRGISFQSEGVKNDCFIEFATIFLGKNSLGKMGQLQPALAKQYDLRNGVYLAELNLEHLVSRRPAEKSFKALPPFPSIRRDVAILLKQITHHEEVLAVIRTAKPAFLETVEIFDVYRGANIPEGQKSMAYTFIYRGAERTLTDSEVNEAHEKIIAAIKEKLSALVREG